MKAIVKDVRRVGTGLEIDFEYDYGRSDVRRDKDTHIVRPEYDDPVAMDALLVVIRNGLDVTRY